MPFAYSSKRHLVQNVTLLFAVLLSVLSLSASSHGDDFIVTQDKAPIKDGANVVGYGRAGERLPVVRQQGEWVLVEATVEGKSIEAWIQRSHGLIDTPKSDPASDAFIAQTLEMAHLFQRTGTRSLEEGEEDSAALGTAAGLYEKALERAEKAYGSKHLVVSDILAQLGELHVQAGSFKQAEPLIERALKIRIPLIPKDHIALSANYNDLGKIYSARGDFDKAKSSFEQAIAIREKNNNQRLLADSLKCLAVLLRDQAKYADAEPHMTRAVAIRESLDDPLKLAQDLVTLGKLYKYRGKLVDAEKACRRAASIYSEKNGEDSLDVALALFVLAETLDEQGKYELALQANEKCLKIREAKLGPGHRSIGDSLNNLAQVYHHLNRFPEAIKTMERCIVNTEARGGAESEDMATTLCNFAAIYSDLGQYAKSESLFEKGIAILRKHVSEEHAFYATAINNLGLLYVRMGNHTAAEQKLRQALAIREKVYHETHAEVAQSINNLGALLMTTGQYELAEPTLIHALEMQRLTLGDKHPHVAVTLNNIGQLYAQMRRGNEADRYFKESLTLREQIFGENHHDVALALSNLGAHYNNAEKYDEAIPVFERSIRIFEQVFGRDYPGMALTLNNLALSHMMKGNSEIAEPLLERARGLMVKNLDPNLHMAGENLATLFASKHDWKKSSALFDESARSLREHVSNVLPILSEKEQILFLNRKHRTSFEVSLSFALHRKDDPSIATQSASWLINGKAVSHQCLAERAIIEHGNLTEDQQNLADELLSTRRLISNALFNPPASDALPEHRKQLEALTTREQQLSQQLGQAISRPTRKNAWVEVAEVQAAIPPDAVFIDFAKFEVRDMEHVGSATVKEPRYVAWIIPTKGKGDVQLIDLGLASELEERIANARQVIQSAPKQIPDEGESESESKAKAALSKLAEQILHPLLSHIGETPRWIMSPDASLWLTPWAALPLPTGEYCIEKHPISFVVSGRDLVAPEKALGGNAPLIFAAPNYERNITGETPGERTSSEAQQRAVAPSTNQDRLPRVAPLPATEIEAELIRPSLASFTKQEVTTLLADQAKEESFKQIHNPQVLVLSTHGFFLDDQVLQRAEGNRLDDSDASTLTTEGRPYQNPLLRCGLMLAGCNVRTNNLQENRDDGVLTGLEIVGADLRQTQLVVLSACETGLGELRKGEGVVGLRQAFQLAGAQAVVASLWQVPDRDTARLMNAFFKAMSDDQSKSESLRNAQLEVIRSRRERSDAAHPFFWAAFTLTGVDRFVAVPEPTGRLLTAEAYLRRGQEFEKKKQFIEALADYDAAIEKDPELEEAYFERGWVHSRLEHNEAALADYDRAISLDADAMGPRVERGKLKLRLGDHDAAIADFDKAIEVLPQVASIRFLRAEAYRFKKEYARAIEDCDQGLGIDPKSHIGWLVKAKSQSGLGLHTQVVESLNQAIEINPQYTSAYSLRADAHYELKDYANAVKDYDAAIKLTPAPDLYLLNSRGLAHEKSGDRRRALEDYDAALKINSNSVWTWNRKAILHAERAEWQEAGDAWQGAIKVDAKDPNYFFNLVVARLEGNDTEEYRGTCQKYFELFGDQKNVANNLAWSCCLAPNAVENYEPFIAIMRQVLKEDADNAVFLGTLGSILYRAGKYDVAEQNSRRAIELSREEVMVEDRIFLAMALHQKNEAEAAQTEWTRAKGWIEEQVASGKKSQHSWSRWAGIIRLRNEAEGLLATPPNVAR